MSAAVDPQWQFARAQKDLEAARYLCASTDAGPFPEQALILLHDAIEKALKAVLLARQLWNGRDRTLAVHSLEGLVQALVDDGFPIPPDLTKDLRDASDVPRVADTACKSLHVEVGHSDHLDWPRLPTAEDLLALADRTLEHVKRECGFS